MVSPSVFALLLTAVEGSSYGTWGVDRRGLPVFNYTLDELHSEIGGWHSGDPPETRTDHFHPFGNRRVNAFAADHGYVWLGGNDRAPFFANRFDLKQRNLGGGFSYVRMEGQRDSPCFCSAHLFGPGSAAETQLNRSFGIGYFASEMEHQGLRVQHTVSAPFGDHPLLLDDVVLENRGDTHISFAHYEYWDVNYHQLVAPENGLEMQPGKRDKINDYFLQSALWEGNDTVRIRSKLTAEAMAAAPTEDAHSLVDYYPQDIFLVQLAGPELRAEHIYTDQQAFFGREGLLHRHSPSRPAAVCDASDGSLLQDVSGDQQPAMLAMRHDLTLGPGESTTLCFAYGFLPANRSTAALVEAFRDPELTDPLEPWKAQVVHLDLPADGGGVIPAGKVEAIKREAIWRSAQLQAASIYEGYYGRFQVPQGGQYKYLVGFDGPSRAAAHSIGALNYLDPTLARDMLQMMVQQQNVDHGGAQPYAFGGFGEHFSFSGTGWNVSDLDIVLFFAASEYLTISGDSGLLHEELSFYPRDTTALPPGASGTSFLDHLRVAWHHLVDTVGLGPHGLVRLLQGDWNDLASVINMFHPKAAQYSQDEGESIPNTQMAVHVLPILAALVEPHDAQLAQNMSAFATQLYEAASQQLQGTWPKAWYPRIWLRSARDEPMMVGGVDTKFPSRGALYNYMDIESQTFPTVWWGHPRLDEAATLLDTVYERLDAPSPVSAMHDDSVEGVTGPPFLFPRICWPSTSWRLNWAYAANSMPARAWGHLYRMTFDAHSSVFPDLWHGTLSGPDAFFARTGDVYGIRGVQSTFDWPVANTENDQAWLRSLFYTLGLEAIPGGLLLNATRSGLVSASGQAWGMTAPVVSFRVEPSVGALHGTYSLPTSGNVTLLIALPAGTSPQQCTVEAEQVQCALDSDRHVVALHLVTRAGHKTKFSVSWQDSNQDPQLQV